MTTTYETRDFAAQMIHAWALADWPVHCTVSGVPSYRTTGLIDERADTVFILGEDGCEAMLPPELLSADTVETSVAHNGVTELRFLFPHSEVVLGDAETGGSDAVH
jgi:hypothetical protein